MMASFGIKDKQIAILGINLAAQKLKEYLDQNGAIVRLIDPRQQAIVEKDIQKLYQDAIPPFHAGELSSQMLEQCQLVIVPENNFIEPLHIEHIRNLGIQIISELEFVSLYLNKPVIAFAGSNGKSTSAYFLKNILEANGSTLFTNLTEPMSLSLQAGPIDYALIVCSTQQLDLCSSFKPKGVVFLNSYWSECKRFPSFEHYQIAQRKVFQNTDSESILVLNGKDPSIANMAQGSTAPCFFFGQETPEDFPGSWKVKKTIFWRKAGNSPLIDCDFSKFRFRGVHNLENAMAAGMMALQLGVDTSTVKTTLLNSKALTGRLRYTKKINDVAFYNDSCSSNTAAIVASLHAFNEPIILIMGGADEEAPFEALMPHIRQKTKNLILVGESKEKINRALGDFTETFIVGTLEEAVLMSYQKARSGDIVLLSPGCSAEDIFKDEIDRGLNFVKIVKELAQPRKPNVI